MSAFEQLLDVYRAAVSRRDAANANFSRSTPGEIADRVMEEKAARQAIVDYWNANEIRWMNGVAKLRREDPQ